MNELEQAKLLSRLYISSRNLWPTSFSSLFDMHQGPSAWASNRHTEMIVFVMKALDVVGPKQAKLKCRAFPSC